MIKGKIKRIIHVGKTKKINIRNSAIKSISDRTTIVETSSASGEQRYLAYNRI